MQMSQSPGWGPQELASDTSVHAHMARCQGTSDGAFPCRSFMGISRQQNGKQAEATMCRPRGICF